LEFYKDVQFATNSIQNQLKKPILEHYNKFCTDLNTLELNRFLDSKGIINDHFKKMLLTQEQENEQQQLIKDNQKESVKFVKGVWSIESVYKSLNNIISECINRYKNQKTK
jgi:hypothetical protein